MRLTVLLHHSLVSECLVLTFGVLKNEFDHESYAIAVQIAAEEINNQQQLLSGYRIELVANETGRDASKGIRIASTMLNVPTFMGYLAAVESSVTTPLTTYLSAFEVNVVASVATSSDLSDRRQYAFFTR